MHVGFGTIQGPQLSWIKRTTAFCLWANVEIRVSINICICCKRKWGNWRPPVRRNSQPVHSSSHPHLMHPPFPSWMLPAPTADICCRLSHSFTPSLNTPCLESASETSAQSCRRPEALGVYSSSGGRWILCDHTWSGSDNPSLLSPFKPRGSKGPSLLPVCGCSASLLSSASY
jgi:hypothetical protein